MPGGDCGEDEEPEEIGYRQKAMYINNLMMP